jgi:hypothetical protein
VSGDISDEEMGVVRKEEEMEHGENDYDIELLYSIACT